MQTTTAWPTNERMLYPVREDCHVTQGPPHYWQCVYLTDALQTFLPDRWVVGDMCLYWEPGNFQKFAAPDVAVIDSPPPDRLPSVYLAWSDPPLLFAAEVASPKDTEESLGFRLDVLRHRLRVPEYLLVEPGLGNLRLWRARDADYSPVFRDALGKIHSEQLGVDFGYDDSGFLRIYTAQGGMLLTHAEQQAELERLRRGSSR